MDRTRVPIPHVCGVINSARLQHHLPSKVIENCQRREDSPCNPLETDKIPLGRKHPFRMSITSREGAWRAENSLLRLSKHEKRVGEEQSQFLRLLKGHNPRPPPRCLSYPRSTPNEQVIDKRGIYNNKYAMEYP